jgi:Flp pilus assembly protein TadD/CheY-like chemotaxis protein
MTIPHTALVIDGHDDEVLSLRCSLPTCGVSPTICNDATVAIKELSSEKNYDFIFVDMHLKNQSAFMFLQLLSQHKNHALRAVPVVGIVGRVNQSELAGLAELGVFNLISKPLSDKLIFEKVNKIVDEYKNPTSTTALDLQFRKAMLKGENARAIALAQKGLEANPKSVRMHVSMAVAHYYAKQDAESWAILTKLLPNLKDSLYLPYVLTLLAKLHIRKKEPQKALQLLEKAQGICPHNMERLLLISELLLSTNKSAMAEQKFRTAIRFFPNSASAKIGLGKSLLAQGDLSGAKKIMETTPGSHQKMLSHLNSLGVEFSRTQRFEEAIQTYETALELVETSKELSSVWYNIALAWSKSGNFGKASSACTKSIQAEPTNEKAKALLLRCGQELTKPGVGNNGISHTLESRETNKGAMAILFKKEPEIACISDELVERVERGILEDALG